MVQGARSWVTTLYVEEPIGPGVMEVGWMVLGWLSVGGCVGYTPGFTMLCTSSAQDGDPDGNRHR